MIENRPELKVSVVLPCLNEAETLEVCIRKAAKSLSAIPNISWEVIVADNGSNDGSQEIALALGARVIPALKRGYGSALINGFGAAEGDIIIMADADDSYELDNLEKFIKPIMNGAELVIGNRFRGEIKKGAMPFLHKYLGNPVLSFIGRKLFRSKIGDFHCGIRAFDRRILVKLQLQASGMEFATEMIVKACIYKIKIVEVPTILSVDGRSRKPHLRTWRDGWRHLIFMLSASPRWAFFYPGLLVIIFSSFLVVNFYQKSLNSFVIGLLLLILGTQLVLNGLITRIFATQFGFLPRNTRFLQIQKMLSFQNGISIGLLGIFSTIVLLIFRSNFTAIESSYVIYSAASVIVICFQIIFSSFLASIINSSGEDLH